MYEDNLSQLKIKSGEKRFKHIINDSSPILPFRSHHLDQTKFDKGFDEIMGDFARILSNKTLEKNLDIDQLIEDMVLNDITVNPENKEFFKLIIKEYLLKSNSELNLLHPYLFLYIEKTIRARADNEKEIAIFFRDVMFKNIENFDSFFTNKETNNLIIKLFLNNIPKLPDKKITKKFISSLDFIIDIFKEDIEFIMNKPNFIIHNLNDIFAFYYFYYCSQVILKLNQPYQKVDLNSPTPVYYILDWEKVSKNRKTVNLGYNLIRDASLYGLVNMSLIEYLNSLSGTQGLFTSQIFDMLEKDEIDKKDYLKILNEWIKYYDEVHQLNNYFYSEKFDELISIFKNDLNEGLSERQKQGFGGNIDNLAKKYFIKKRGQYGNILNINKENLYLITALCIKDEKIKLNDLFKEYERRGLFFDRHSKEEIVTLLNKWNLIHKKSDSGDAQYVKQIL